MTVALWLFAIQACLGGFDTLYYHEWRARLPARYPQTAPELKLHAVRDFLYAVLFLTLPYVTWHGAWTFVLAAVFAAEIGLTLSDFVVEIKVRKSFGDVVAGERVTHAVMGILYGAAIANLVPVLLAWRELPSGLVLAPPDVPAFLRLLLTAMGCGVLISGARDLYAAYGLPGGGWPWTTSRISSVEET